MTARSRDDDLDYVQDSMGTDLDSVLIHNLLRTRSYLTPLIHADLRRQDLTSAQFNALLVLRAAGARGLRMGEIGRRLVVTKSNVTGLVDRLERQGWAVRTEPSDRRATVVRLTNSGAKLIARIAPRHVGLFAQLTRCLAVREKRMLIRLLTKLRRELRRRRKGEA